MRRIYSACRKEALQKARDDKELHKRWARSAKADEEGGLPEADMPLHVEWRTTSRTLSELSLRRARDSVSTSIVVVSGISKVKQDGDRLLTVCSEAQDDAEGAGGPWEERLCLDADQKTKMDEMIDLQNTASATTDVEKRAQLQKEYDLACAQLQELFVGSEDISSGAISDYVMDAIARAEGNGREVSRTSYVIVLAYCGSRLTPSRRRRCKATPGWTRSMGAYSQARFTAEPYPASPPALPL